jgi:hypothetical protein
VRQASLSRFPVGDLNEQVGVVEHLESGASEEAARIRAMFRYYALNQGLELGALACLACSSTMTLIAMHPLLINEDSL